MTFPWPEYLELADALLTNRGTFAQEEACCRSSISRAYYAALRIAQLALLTVGERPGTHAGVSNRFYVHFVETGRIPLAVGRLLPDAARQRQSADYDAFTIFEVRPLPT